MKTIILIFSFIFPALMLLSCKQEEKASGQATTQAFENVYKTDTVKLAHLEDELILNGSVSFDEDSVVRVFPVVSGKVESVKVQLGAYVKQGEELAIIKSADVTNLIKDYEVDKANLELSKKNLQNAEALYKSGFASETDLLTAKKEVANNQQELARAQEVLRIYGGATQSNKPYFVVKAPISGYIVDKKVNTGQEMRPDNSDEIFMISNLRSVWVMANVYETDIADIKLGQSVEIKVLAYPNITFVGKISNLSNVLNENSRVMKVRIEIDNKDGLLKPNMFASIHLHLKQPEKMLTISPKALIFDNDKYYVVKMDSANTFSVREVEMVKNTSKYVYVKGSIKAGEHILTEGSLLVYNELVN